MNRITLVSFMAVLTTIVSGQSLSKTYTSTISSLCTNRICSPNLPSLTFDLPDGAADHIEIIGVDIAYNMTGDCTSSNSSSVRCTNTNLASPSASGNKGSGIKTVSHNNLTIANGIYPKAAEVEFKLGLIGGSCFCYSATCDIIASTWTVTVHYNLIYFNSRCEVATSIQPYDNSPCCEESVLGDTYLVPDRWYSFIDNSEDYSINFNSENSEILSLNYYYTESDCDDLIQVTTFINIPTGADCYVHVSCNDPQQGNCDGNTFELCVSTIPAKATINYGDTCFSKMMITGCNEKWYSFIATDTAIIYTTCTPDFGNATTSLYRGSCDDLSLLISDDIDFEYCDEERFKELTPGDEYWIHVEAVNDGCDDNRVTTLCIKMATSCNADLVLTGEIADTRTYKNFKSISLDSVQLKHPGSLFLSATESIKIDESSEIESTATLETYIEACKELTCGDGYDDDNDGILDCDDPDCIGLLPQCSLGGTLFIDFDKNGLNVEEPGLEGILVQLFNEGNDPSIDIPFEQTVSDQDGGYEFNLDNGNYFIYIPTTLSAYPSVSPSQINIDNGVDNDNNGLQSDQNNDNVTDGPITSPIITLCPGTESIDDGDNANGDFTIDVGFTTAGCMNQTYECDCNDGIDNDGNGDIDCADQACGQELCCFIECNCDDNIDNDGDELADCDDPDCTNFVYPTECNCNDGIDNDGDQLVDCDDSDCANFIYDFECNCLDGIDNDGDGLIDTLDDNDCV